MKTDLDILENRKILSNREQMTALCKSFPILRGAWGTEPWDQYEFARWASNLDGDSADEQAAAFVLTVWNNSQPADGGWWNEGKFSAGRFDVVRAMMYWDYQQKAAFFAWCERPFYP